VISGQQILSNNRTAVIDLVKYNRNSLTKHQKEFLEKLIPWARFIQEQTRIKANVFKKIKSPHGIFAGLVIADIIYYSNWGEHPLAQEKYRNKLSNNLALLEANDYWSGKSIKYENQDYKLFNDWENFSIHYSDLIVFSGWYSELLKCSRFDEQIFILSLIKPNPVYYNETVKKLIESFNLGEFNGT